MSPVPFSNDLPIHSSSPPTGTPAALVSFFSLRKSIKFLPPPSAYYRQGPHQNNAFRVPRFPQTSNLLVLDFWDLDKQFDSSIRGHFFP